MKHIINFIRIFSRIILKGFFVAFITVFSVFPAFADDVLLEWDVNPDAAYYIVCWGVDSGDYTEGCSYEIYGDITTFPLEDSPDGTEYYYSVKAFNYFGNSSDFSEEVKTAHVSVGDYSPIFGDYSPIYRSENGDNFLTNPKHSIAISENDMSGCFIGAVKNVFK